jgi:hypothetical protein
MSQMVGGWYHGCGNGHVVVSEIQPSLGPCPFDFAGVGGKRVFQELRVMLPNPGKRLMCSDTGMKNRLEMEPSMPIACHAVVVSSLDPGTLARRACLAKSWHSITVIIMHPGNTYDLLAGLF